MLITLAEFVLFLMDFIVFWLELDNYLNLGGWRGYFTERKVHVMFIVYNLT